MNKINHLLIIAFFLTSISSVFAQEKEYTPAPNAFHFGMGPVGTFDIVLIDNINFEQDSMYLQPITFVNSKTLANYSLEFQKFVSAKRFWSLGFQIRNGQSNVLLESKHPSPKTIILNSAHSLELTYVNLSFWC